MGRDTTGVAGMKLRAGDEVIEVDIADDDADLLVVTENGYGKRTRVGDYPAKGRGTMGVKTVQLVERKGRLAGARIVRDGYQVMLISDGGTVIKIPVDGIRRAGRSTQGVIVMRLREGEQVATLAPVIGSDDEAEAETDIPAPATGADEAEPEAVAEEPPA
jgi:DNA gyrase subunit A